MTHSRVIPFPMEAARPKPPPACRFTSAAEVWLWTTRTIALRRSGGGERRAGDPRRPCTPEEVLSVLAALWERRRIGDEQARVLRLYGDRQAAPNPERADEWEHHQTWTNAMELLTWAFRVKGFIA